MAKQFLSVKNYDRFQHYTQRRPPWVKLYWTLLDDEEFVRLSLANRGLYCHFILLASRYANHIPYDLNHIQIMLRLPEKPDVSALIDAGFLLASRYRRASKTLDLAYSDARPLVQRSEIQSSEDQSTEKKDSLVGLTPNEAGGGESVTGQAEEVLAFLNEKAGRNFRVRESNHRPSVNLDFIIARLKSGATVQDCKGIIARKCREWKGTEQEKYLRPATLFNKTKFEQYIGEAGT